MSNRLANFLRKTGPTTIESDNIVVAMLDEGTGTVVNDTARTGSDPTSNHGTLTAGTSGGWTTIANALPGDTNPSTGLRFVGAGTPTRVVFANESNFDVDVSGTFSVPFRFYYPSSIRSGGLTQYVIVSKMEDFTTSSGNRMRGWSIGLLWDGSIMKMRLNFWDDRFGAGNKWRTYEYHTDTSADAWHTSTLVFNGSLGWGTAGVDFDPWTMKPTLVIDGTAVTFSVNQAGGGDPVTMLNNIPLTLGLIGGSTASPDAPLTGTLRAFCWLPHALSAKECSLIHTFASTAADAPLAAVRLGELRYALRTERMIGTCMGDSITNGSSADASWWQCFGERLKSYSLVTQLLAEYIDPRSYALGLAVNVTGASATHGATTTIAQASHGLNTGDVIYVSASTTTPDISGDFYDITKINANSFSIAVVTTVDGLVNYDDRQVSVTRYGVGSTSIPAPFNYSLTTGLGYPVITLSHGPTTYADGDRHLIFADTYGNVQTAAKWRRFYAKAMLRDSASGGTSDMNVYFAKSSGSDTALFTSASTNLPHVVVGSDLFGESASGADVTVELQDTGNAINSGQDYCYAGHWLVYSNTGPFESVGFVQGPSLSDDGWKVLVQHSPGTTYSLSEHAAIYSNCLPGSVRPNLVVISAWVNDIDFGSTSTDYAAGITTLIGLVRAAYGGSCWVHVEGGWMAESGSNTNVTYARCRDFNDKTRTAVINAGARVSWHSIAEDTDYAVIRQALRDGLHPQNDTATVFARKWVINHLMDAISAASEVSPTGKGIAKRLLLLTPAKLRVGNAKRRIMELGG